MKTTRKIIDIQQSGDNETKILLTLWEPTIAGQAALLRLLVEGHEDGAFANGRIHLEEYALTFDGTDVAAAARVAGGNAQNVGFGVPKIQFDVLNDGQVGGNNDKIVLVVIYSSVANVNDPPWLYNFTIDAELVELAG